MQTFARLALEIAKEQGMFLVIDADGLYTVGGNLDLIRGYRRAVLTPNIVEFKRLSELVVRATPCTVLFYHDKLVARVRALIPIHGQRTVHHWCQKDWAG
jgi:NAD(P)H-hydrate repair Nnr-like enzyme with NAD(P)H-hydrate dehydratase domain